MCHSPLHPLCADCATAEDGKQQQQPSALSSTLDCAARDVNRLMARCMHLEGTFDVELLNVMPGAGTQSSQSQCPLEGSLDPSQSD